MMTEESKVTILWGESSLGRDEPITYTFDTKAEADAFRLGVNEGVGWHGAEEIAEVE